MRSRFASSFLEIITHTSSGKIYPIYALVIPFIIDKGVDISKLGIIAFAFQVPFYLLSKNLVKRTRPSLEDGIRPLIKAPDRYSFPSGHCASSMLFTLIINQYTPEMTFYFIVWMTIIFISRVSLGLHYLSDAIFGISLGLLSFYVGSILLTIFF